MEKQYKELLNKINAGHYCVMLSYLDNKNKTMIKKEIITQKDVEGNVHKLPQEILDRMIISLETGKIQIMEGGENTTIIIEPFNSKPRLIVFGGGHISKPLTEFATRVGFSVTVVDDRPSFANIGRFPEVDEVICDSFESTLEKIKFRKTDFVAIVTRGHRYDGVILREVVKHDLAYVGMIGSRRRVKGMIKQLLEEGYAQERLDRVNAPIGLDIAAISPDEIAISIVAQMIDRKNRDRIDKNGKKFTISEFDPGVIEKVYEPSPLPKALITIISAKGSVPRKAGAKMIAYYDGKTIGSIGGGCSEADILTKARDIMLDKGFAIEHVDMTGDVAESEGMVCGGVMDVLIEVF